MQYGLTMLSESFRRGWWVPIGTTAQNTCWFYILHLNPISFKFLISYTKISSFDSIQWFAGVKSNITCSWSGRLWKQIIAMQCKALFILNPLKTFSLVSLTPITWKGKPNKSRVACKSSRWASNWLFRLTWRKEKYGFHGVWFFWLL